MAVQLISNEKIAETSSKGNQEKWFDRGEDRWYKLDQFGYEGLAETAISLLLEETGLETATPFTFVRYRMERLRVHGRERVGCSSGNFLRPGQALITLNRLVTQFLGQPLSQKLASLPSQRQRIKYLAEATAAFTGLRDFPQYLTLLFEVDALFCNDDRHLNNIAVIEENGRYQYCPIFDNGAGLLSNLSVNRADIEPHALISALRARPFNMTFTRQRNTAQALFGKQFMSPKWTRSDISDVVIPLLTYYPAMDRDVIAARVTECIMERQGK